jgi:hypothetical protein
MSSGFPSGVKSWRKRKTGMGFIASHAGLFICVLI